MATATAFAGSWNSLPTPLTPWILDVIESLGHEKMTPVQASTIPLFMAHKDVVVEAVTGSGKTLAFVIPILEKLLRRETALKANEIGALVISPTRELATQIHSVFNLFLSSQPGSESGEHLSSPSSRLPPPLLLISSETSTTARDIERFTSTSASLVIGTPGRVEEFLLGRGRSSVSVRELDVLVLDEADRLLDLGFQASLTRIINALPKQRRTGLFSATMTDADALSELVRVGLRNPARIVVKVQTKKTKKGEATGAKGGVIEERRIPANLQNFYMTCKTSEKLVQLARIIQYESSRHNSARFIVYFSTCACVDYFYCVLPLLLPSSTTLHSLHGHLPPATRTRALAAFADAAATTAHPHVLLATDVAARGLDLPNVDVVLQFDAPADPSAYAHRCGRTARAGRSGRAWVLLCGREMGYVDFMAIRKIPMKRRLCFLEDLSLDSLDVAEPEAEAKKVEDVAVPPTLAKIRGLLTTDRSLHDKAAKAFVSSVRAYSKHQATYIFRVQDLDLVGLARAFGLLRLPRMPEFSGLPKDTWEDAAVNWDTFAYIDPAKEAKRQAQLAEKASRSQAEIDKEGERRRRAREEKTKANEAWSVQTSRREERERRREKKNKKRKWIRAHAKELAAEGATTASGEIGVKRLRDDEGDAISDGSDANEDEWKEMAREERMAKKLRKGVVSQREFDAEFGDL